MFALHTQMTLLLALLFGVIYAIITVFGAAMGQGSFNFYLILAFGFMIFQYLIGPKMVEWSMKVRYIKREDNPKLFDMVQDQAQKAGLPPQKVAISAMSIPNAFAFGRGHRDGRVCVTQGIMNLLNDEELRAVVGHEIGHIKNRDVLTITLLSVIPIIMYRIAWHFMFFGGGRREEGGPSGLVLGMMAFGFYFLTNLLVTYGSRVREYYADKAAVELGNRPEALATALYKLVYGSARMGKQAIKDVEGLKAFFMNDPSKSMNEIKDLAQLDFDQSGTIDPDELAVLRHSKINISGGDKLMELMSTHPNMLKRIKHLSTLA